MTKDLFFLERERHLMVVHRHLSYAPILAHCINPPGRKFLVKILKLFIS